VAVEPTTRCQAEGEAVLEAEAQAEVEQCWRCGAAMEWRHGTWQCGRCRFKLGCCEGEPQSCDAAEARRV
jgi:hypothetical protein